jgi:hypothetical protein
MHARTYVLALLVFLATQGTALFDGLGWSRNIYALFFELRTMTTSHTPCTSSVVSLICDTPEL